MKISASQLLSASTSSSSIINQSIRKMHVQASETLGPETRSVNLSLSRSAEYHYQSSLEQVYTSRSQIHQANNDQLLISNDEALTKMLSASLSGNQALAASIQVQGAAVAGPVNSGIMLRGQAELEFSSYQFYQKHEALMVSSQGMITTDDGKSISFSLQLALEQEVTIESTQTLRIEQRMTDPLVVNFAASTARLTDTVFNFDLTGDGDMESLAVLGRGSGYLVLDHNGNHRVDDGGELFGPMTGRGFSELARYDQDGNHWIDENDAIFEKLRVWVDQGNGGEGSMKSLAEVGVGAIHLDQQDSAFDLIGGHGVVLGQLKSTGILLMEDGEVRTIQEIDLADQKAQEIELEQSVQQQDRDVERMTSILQALGRLDELREQQSQHYEHLRDQFLGKAEESELTTPESIEENLMEQWLEFVKALKEQLLEKTLNVQQADSEDLESQPQFIDTDELLESRSGVNLKA